jgi:hypothetical protein
VDLDSSRRTRVGPGFAHNLGTLPERRESEVRAVACPFCGVVDDAPHEKQEACIGALQSEIARTRSILERVTKPVPPASTAEKNDRH